MPINSANNQMEFVVELVNTRKIGLKLGLFANK